MRADLRPEPVLERRDDAAAVRVVLRVGRREQHDVERKAHLVAPDLDVALLQHVEQTHLDALREVGQFVEREDAAVRAGDEAVVQRELVAQVAALGHLDRVDLADQIGDRRVGRGELLAVAGVTMDPVDRGGVAMFLHERTRVGRDGVVWVIVDLGPLDDRHPFVEQIGQPADHPRLRLTALTQKDHVVTGEQCVLQLGQNGVLVAEHGGHDRVAVADAIDGVAPKLLRHRNGRPSARLQLTQRVRSRHLPLLPQTLRPVLTHRPATRPLRQTRRPIC